MKGGHGQPPGEGAVGEDVVVGEAVAVCGDDAGEEEQQAPEDDFYRHLDAAPDQPSGAVESVQQSGQGRVLPPADGHAEEVEAALEHSGDEVDRDGHGHGCNGCLRHQVQHSLDGADVPARRRLVVGQQLPKFTPRLVQPLHSHGIASLFITLFLLNYILILPLCQ